MSWRGSTGHLDANVPDYQKMLQGRSSSSGWSSTQPSFSSYSSRFPGASGNSSSYMSPRNHSGYHHQGSSHGGYSNTYQPSKYGLAVESSYNTTASSGFRNLPPEESVLRPENGYNDKTYGFVGREFDLEPYRSQGHRGTDYSSDSGRVPVPRRTPDYSSDSGMSFKRHSGKSSDFELEIPSPVTSRSQSRSQNEDMIFSSPVKSKVQVSDYYRFSEKQSGFNEPQGRAGHLTDYRNLSRSEPNLDNYHNTLIRNEHNGQQDIEEISPRQDHDDSQENVQENGAQDNDDDEIRANFTSPTLYHGDIADLSIAQRNNIHVPRNKASDLSQWQQKQRPTTVTDHNKPPLKPSSRTAYHKEKLYRDYTHDAHSDTEISPRDTRDHPSPRHHDIHNLPASRHDIRDITSSRNHDIHDLPASQHDIRDIISSRNHDIHEHSSSRHDTRDITSTRHLDSHDMSSEHHDSHGLSSRYISAPSSDQMNQIRSAADAIIRDKDSIIEELKDRVLSLEEMVKEYENKLRRSFMSRGGHNDDGATFSKMQELEYRNAELRTDLAKVKLQKETEVEDLEIKLGGVEHEVVQLKAALKKTQPNTAHMKELLQERDESLQDWKRKHNEQVEKFERLKEKLDGMERYLSDLPTLEEFTKNAEDLASCSEEMKLKTAQVSDLEERLSDTTQQLSDRESTIHELENKQRQLAVKMRELTSEIHRIKTIGEGKALADTQEELAETQELKDKATHDLDKAKKLLEMNHRRLRQMEAKHGTEVRHLQERLGQEEESVMAMREEMRLKEEQVAKLKRSLKDFAGKNQDLMDEGLMLKEQLHQFETTSIDETQKLQRRFVREMSVCFSDLQSLVQILVQQAEGKDPNVSLLLGTRTSMDEEGATGGSMNDEQSLKHWFSKLRELRGEVEEVRNIICNKYAKDMGDNLNCATQ